MNLGPLNMECGAVDEAKLIREVDEPSTPASVRWLKNATPVVLFTLASFMALAFWMHERDARTVRPTARPSIVNVGTATLDILTCGGTVWRMAPGEMAIVVHDGRDGCLQVIRPAPPAYVNAPIVESGTSGNLTVMHGAESTGAP